MDTGTDDATEIVHTGRTDPTRPDILDLQDVTLRIANDGAVRTVVRDINLRIGPGEFYALVGESGSGKTMIARAAMRLLPDALLRIDGRILFQGRDITAAAEPELRRLRGNRISMIFQEPMTSLNPLMIVGEQIGEAVDVHRRMGRRERDELIETVLGDVSFDEPGKIRSMYPHELSGGMRQRVMIAAALVNNPSLLIADEPTTALDVTIQREILDILARLSSEHGLAVLFISHDLDLVRQNADRVGVLYGGMLMEEGTAADIAERPAHPYTAALLDCVPRRRDGGRRQAGIEGTVPRIDLWAPECRFIARCPRARPACAHDIALRTGTSGRRVRCIDPVHAIEGLA